MVPLRDEQLVIQITALEIFVPGRGLLIEHLPLFAETPISLSVRRAFFIGWAAGIHSILYVGSSVARKNLAPQSAILNRQSAIWKNRQF